MAWSGMGLRSGSGNRQPGRLAGRAPYRARRVMAALAASMLAWPPLAPSAVAITAGAATVTAAGAAWWRSALPAKAATPPPVLILGSSVNGGTSSAEYQAAVAAGYSPTVLTDSTWESEPRSYFAGFNAIIIGDPSSGGTCAHSVPAALSYLASGQASPVWTQAVTGNVTVLGTAPALAGSKGTALIAGAITYAASGTGTGLYVSLNCEGSSASPGADLGAGWLDDVDGTGVTGAGTLGGATITAGQGWSCGDSGAVNPQAAADPGYTALAASSLTGWASPACPVQETFGAWPAWLTPVAYDTSASPADFTSPDGTLAGQPYVLAGQVPGAGLAPSVGGQIPLGSQAGGSNPAAPAVNAAMAADPVNTENGDLSEASTDLSIPTFGPGLDFTRTYDAGQARLQAIVGAPVPVAPSGPSGNGNGAAPGSMGYGWTSNWDTWAGTGQPTPGDLYTISGLRTDNGNGGPATAQPLNQSGAVAMSGGDTYIADTAGNRVEEVAGANETEWGVSMTKGDMYTIVGSPTGQAGQAGNGATIGPNGTALLNQPNGIAVSSTGLFISDTGNCRVLEVPRSGTNADEVEVYAGQNASNCTGGNDNKPAIDSGLNGPEGLHFGYGSEANDLYIADTGNSRIQEVAGANETEWNQQMTAGDVYTIAGTDTASGASSNGTAAASSLLEEPGGVTLNGSNDLFIADTMNCRVEEVPSTTRYDEWNGNLGTMNANDIYTIAGRSGTSCGGGGNNKEAIQSDLAYPSGVAYDATYGLYIADTGSNVIKIVADNTSTQYGQAMTEGDIYSLAGNQTQGDSGDGGPALSAEFNQPAGIAVIGGAVTIADTGNNEVRALGLSSPYDIADVAGGIGFTLGTTGNNGPALGSAYLHPYGVASDAMGNLYIADELNNRIQEIAASSHTQFGVAMTAGEVYTIAGNAYGEAGLAGDGGKATSALLNSPLGVAVDSAGDVFIADSGNNRVQKVTPIGTISTIAGSATGVPGSSSALLDGPESVAVDGSGNVYIADMFNNRVQEVTAGGNVKTIAGSATGSAGTSGDGGPATSALLSGPAGVAVDSSGDLFIADASNNRIQEIYATGGNSWGKAMTAGDIYTVAGSASGGFGTSGDGRPAATALLAHPVGLAVDSSGDLYIADTDNNRVQEIATTSGTQWGQSMTANAVYTIAGSPAGTWGDSGVGGPGISALLNGPSDLAVDPAGNLVIPDDTNNVIDEAIASPGSALYPVSPAGTGITITQPGQSQVTFYPEVSGACPTGYVTAGTGGYCAPPEDTTATLTYSSSNRTFTYSPSPGLSYTYNASGALASEADTAGDTLTVSYGTPAPGSGNCPPAANWCQTVTSASGRALTIGYNSANLITSVTDPMGRQWQYAYDGASQLTSATDPMGNVTSYTYGQGSTGNPSLTNDLLTITGPNAQPGGPDAGQATVNAYDNQGRVTSQTDPMGNATKFSYCVSAQAGNCLNTAAGGGSVTVTDPQGNQAKYTFASGALTASAVWNGAIRGGGATLATSSYSTPNQAAGTQLDLATIDGNGNVTTYKFNSAGYATTTTQPDGIGSQAAAMTRTITPLGEVSCYSSFESPGACAQNPGSPPVQPGQAITPPPAPPAGLVDTQFDTTGNELFTTRLVNGAPVTSYALFQADSVTLNGTNITCTTQPPSRTLPCATISPAGVVTQLTYNAYGDLTSSSAPDGNSGGEVAKTTYSYDGDGEQTSVTSPDGNLPSANSANYTLATVYNKDGETTSTSQGGGTGATVTPRTESFSYDADGNEITSTDARGYTTTTGYNADDQATLATDPLGNSVLTCYDADGNIAQTVPAVGVAASSLKPSSCPSAYPAGYNPAGSARLASDSMMTTYDSSGQQIATYTPAPAGQTGYETTSYQYDANGNVTQVAGPPASPGGQPEVSSYTYSTTDDMTSATTADGTVTYCYDANGDQTATVAADGNANGTAPCNTNPNYPGIVDPTAFPTQAAYQTTSTYDASGDLLSTITPATTATGPNGGKTTYTYNAAGQPLSMTDPNAVTSTYAYSPLGEITSVSYSGNSAPGVSYSYDAEGGMMSMTDGSGTSRYIYDPFGELTSATNGAGQAVGYSYDPDGDTTGITYPLPATATWASTDTVGYSYDKGDNLSSVTDFNGHNINVTLNADTNPVAETLGSTGDNIATTYDATGAPSAVSLKNSSSTLQSFTYSAAPNGDVMTETDTPSSSQSPASYTYDSQGRLTSMTPGTGQKLNYAFDHSGNLLTLPSGADASSGYNNAGELTKSVMGGVTTTYAYDAAGQQLSATQGATQIGSGTWNGAGELTAYTDSAAAMASAVYDGNGLRAAASFTPAGGSQAPQAFVWDNADGGNDLLMDPTNAYVYATDGSPTEQVNLSTGSVSYLVKDTLGSVRGTVSNSGALTATTSYDAWGNPQTAGGLTAYTPFGFAGGYTDPTGLIYLIYRYYNPVTGQFLSVDPALSDTGQPYQYADANPVTGTDPTGEAAKVRKVWDYKYWNVGSHSTGGWDACAGLDWVVEAYVCHAFGAHTKYFYDWFIAEAQVTNKGAGPRDTKIIAGALGFRMHKDAAHPNWKYTSCYPEFKVNYYHAGRNYKRYNSVFSAALNDAGNPEYGCGWSHGNMGGWNSDYRIWTCHGTKNPAPCYCIPDKWYCNPIGFTVSNLTSMRNYFYDMSVHTGKEVRFKETDILLDRISKGLTQ